MSFSFSLPSNVSTRGMNALGIVPALVLLLCASLLLALETPSKPFLDKNSFYLTSAGFKVHFANDAAGKQALHALPPHRFVIHNLGGGDVRYLYAEPQNCVCVFIGTQGAYTSYRDMLSQPMEQTDNVAPDYKTQASALLTGDPVDMAGQPPYAAEYFRNYY
jgi:hypothetical protein